MNNVKDTEQGAKKIRVLLLESDATDAELIVRALHDASLTFQAVQIETEAEFIRELEQCRPDVILCDHGLPGLDTLDALAIARQKCSDVPFLVVSGGVPDARTLQILSLNAAGYIPKHQISRLAPAVLGALCETEDRAKRHHAEDKVRQVNEELEQCVKQRTAQLEAANKELESFGYTVSHDLRAPLRHIEAFVKILQERATAQLDPENQRYLQIIADEAKRMSKLIADLLAFSLLRSAKLQKQPVDLGALVQAVLQDLHHDMEGRQIEWVIGDLPTVQADASLLRQVLVNFISNAIKYTRPRPQARVEIGATTTEQETTVFIRDNGVGFDMRHAGRLFGVFQRLHGLAEFEGSGIGLANARQIIQRHGGRTWAEGVWDAGATFYFSLPHNGGAEQ